MINHFTATLVCHVTFSTCSLAYPEGQFETITLLFDPNPNPIPNKTKSIRWNSNWNPNEKFDQLPYITWSTQFFANISPGGILTLCHGGLFEISVWKCIYWCWFQLLRAFLEKSRRSTVEWFSTLGAETNRDTPNQLEFCKNAQTADHILTLLTVDLHKKYVKANKGRFEIVLLFCRLRQRRP